MSDFDEDTDAARLVARAKGDKEKVKDLKEDGDIAGAVRVLAATLQIFDTSPLVAALETAPRASRAQRDVATQLADILGQMGGNLRRLNKLAEAQACFDRGSQLEASPVLEVMSSYNLVNAITLPIERDAAALDVQQEALTQAVTALERQTATDRRTDRWAWADRAQCQLLLGRINDALQSYMQVRRLGDEDTVASIVGVLDRMASKTPALALRVAEARKVLGSMAPPVKVSLQRPK